VAYQNDKLWNPGDFPLTEKLAMEILSLPMSAHLTVKQVEFITDMVKRQ